MNDVMMHSSLKRIVNLRDLSAWLLCFSFFFMIPLEYAALDWIKTPAGKWSIVQAVDHGAVYSYFLTVWSILAMGVAFIFFVVGCITSFKFEVLLSKERNPTMSFVYYTAWLQTFFLIIAVLPGDWIKAETSQWYSMIHAYSAQFLMLCVGLLMYKKKLSDIGLKRIAVGTGIKVLLIGVVLYVAVFPNIDVFITRPIAELFSLDLSSWRENMISDEIRKSMHLGLLATAFQIIMLGVIVPIGEEIMFRGVFQGAFTRWVGVLGGIFFSAATFALFHIDVTLLAPLFIMGLILASLRVVFKSLWGPIILHILNNTISVLLDL